MDYFEFAVFSQCLRLDSNNITDFFEQLPAAQGLKKEGLERLFP